MIPQWRALAALCVVAAGRPDEDAYLEQQRLRVRVRFPGEPLRFLGGLDLPPGELTALRTTDPRDDARPGLAIAETIGVRDFVGVGVHGLELVTSPGVIWLRRNAPTLEATECLLLAGRTPGETAADLRTMYQREILESDVAEFARLFMDRDTLPGGLAEYATCFAPEEFALRRKAMDAPVDYIRWKLGAILTLDTSRVLDRFISDGYFESLELKAERGGRLTATDIARIKMSQDTVFKAIDRKAKIAAAAPGPEDGASKAAAAIEGIKLRYAPAAIPLLSELT